MHVTVHPSSHCTCSTDRAFSPFGLVLESRSTPGRGGPPFIMKSHLLLQSFCELNTLCYISGTGIRLSSFLLMFTAGRCDKCHRPNTDCCQSTYTIYLFISKYPGWTSLYRRTRMGRVGQSTWLTEVETWRIEALRREGDSSFQDTQWVADVLGLPQLIWGACACVCVCMSV